MKKNTVSILRELLYKIGKAGKDSKSSKEEYSSPLRKQESASRHLSSYSHSHTSPQRQFGEHSSPYRYSNFHNGRLQGYSHAHHALKDSQSDLVGNEEGKIR